MQRNKVIVSGYVIFLLLSLILAFVIIKPMYQSKIIEGTISSFKIETVNGISLYRPIYIYTVGKTRIERISKKFYKEGTYSKGQKVNIQYRKSNVFLSKIIGLTDLFASALFVVVLCFCHIGSLFWLLAYNQGT